MAAWLVVVLVVIAVLVVLAVIAVLMRRAKRGRLLISRPAETDQGGRP